MELWLWLAATLAALVLYSYRLYWRFAKYGVKMFVPVPILGNVARVVFRMEHLSDHLDRSYKAFPEERFIGNYEFEKATVLVRDLELIKKITIKDHEYFTDRRIIIDRSADPLFGRNLVSLQGQEWKDMRLTLTPAFTSSKIRMMMSFIDEVANNMTSSLEKKIKGSDIGSVDIEMKDLTARFATDVIASCAFGLQVNSHSDQQNTFYMMGKNAPNFFNVGYIVKLVLVNLVPYLIKILKMGMFSEETSNFFRDIIINTMKEREAQHILRPDMIHLLMEAKKGKLANDDKRMDCPDSEFAGLQESQKEKKITKREWTNDDLVAQALLFFVAGFDTVSTVITFMLYELAVNPDVQEKLVKEIREVDAKNGGKLDYNSIQNMPYMDMVLSEVLRLWTSGLIQDRVCTKDYNLGKPNNKADKDFIIRKGEMVQFPVWAIHRNTEYFPNPNKFDPDRFSEENKSKIKPFTYIPFGSGPRGCLGFRFALCEMKVMVYQLLKCIELLPAAKTTIPPKISTKKITLQVEGGFWVRMKLRT